MADLKWRALAPGCHPPVSRLKQNIKVGGKPVCPCQVPEAIVSVAFGQMFFAVSEQDAWVVDMIRLADVGFLD